MIFRRLLPAVLSLPLVALPVLAHEPGAWANGGVRVDAGHYHLSLIHI